MRAHREMKCYRGPKRYAPRCVVQEREEVARHPCSCEDSVGLKGHKFIRGVMVLMTSESVYTKQQNPNEHTKSFELGILWQTASGKQLQALQNSLDRRRGWKKYYTSILRGGIRLRLPSLLFCPTAPSESKEQWRGSWATWNDLGGQEDREWVLPGRMRSHLPKFPSYPSA